MTQEPTSAGSLGGRIRLSLAAACLTTACLLAARAGADHNATELVSAGQVNGNGAFNVEFRGSSEDGSRVFFHSDEQLVAADTDGAQDVYERSGGQTTLVSRGEINGNGAPDSFFSHASADGSMVFFHTEEQLVAADTDDSQDVYRRSNGQTTLISVGEINGNDEVTAGLQEVSADGSRAIFATQEQLVVADTDGSVDVYERSGGQTSLVSAGEINGNGAFFVSVRGISEDASHVFFATAEQLVAADTDSFEDVYQRAGGQTTLVSQGEINGNGDFGTVFSTASADGSRVFFATQEQLVAADTDAQFDSYERSGGQTTLVSQGEINGNGASTAFIVGSSADGSRAFFQTDEQLVDDDDDNALDSYERAGGQTTLVTEGEINGDGAFGASFARASADGSRVFFITAEQLVGDDGDGTTDVYERSGGQTTLVSRGDINGNGLFNAQLLGASDDGSRAFFQTGEQLVAADTDGSQDVYQRAGGQTTLISRGEINGNGGFAATFRGTSADGTSVFFTTFEQLAGADADSAMDLYARVVAPPAPPPPDPAPQDPPGGDGGDSTAPDTTITAGPRKKEKKRRASFEFSSTEAGSRFECSLDDDPFEPCASPADVRVRKGRHTFEVRAIDAAGNADPTPAESRWKFKKKRGKGKNR